MAKRQLIASLTTALVLTSSYATAYETWQAEDMELRVDLTAYSRSAGKQFQHTGDLMPIVDATTPGSYQQFGTTLDAEFGLFQDVALYLVTSFQSANLKSEFGGARVTGLSDFFLGGKWRMVDSAVTLTLAPEIKFPTGYTPETGAFRPVLGNGVNEYTARIWFGKRFDDAPFYFELGSGYRLRGSRVPRGGGPKLIYTDEIPYDMEVGYWFSRSIAAHLFLDGVVGLGQPETLEAVELSPVSQSYTHLGGGLTYRLSPVFRLMGQYRRTVTGINALNEQFIGLSLSLSYGI